MVAAHALLGCPDLCSLELSRNARVTDAGIVALVRACPRLESLRAEHLPHVGDRALLAIAGGGGSAAGPADGGAADCGSSIRANGDSSAAGAGAGASSSGFGLTLLRQLYLDGCARVTDAGVRFLASSVAVCKTQTLRILSFLTCYKVTAKAVAMFPHSVDVRVSK